MTAIIETPLSAYSPFRDRWFQANAGEKVWAYDTVDSAPYASRVDEAVSEAEALVAVPPDVARSFTEYTHDPKRVFAWRDRVARAIQRLQKN